MATASGHQVIAIRYEQGALWALDQTVLPSKPLVVGAGYEKNPEVFKPDGTTDFSNTDKCPA